MVNSLPTDHRDNGEEPRGAGAPAAAGAALPDLSPAGVLEQVATALPACVRDKLIVVGSLAAGYHFFADDTDRAIRTKDVDCLFTPNLVGGAAAGAMAVVLLMGQKGCLRC